MRAKVKYIRAKAWYDTRSIQLFRGNRWAERDDQGKHVRDLRKQRSLSSWRRASGSLAPMWSRAPESLSPQHTRHPSTTPSLSALRDYAATTPIWRATAPISRESFGHSTESSKCFVISATTVRLRFTLRAMHARRQPLGERRAAGQATKAKPRHKHQATPSLKRSAIQWPAGGACRSSDSISLLVAQFSIANNAAQPPTRLSTG